MITIGNLAKELRTSNQKLGHLIKHYDLKFEIQYKKGSQKKVLTAETTEMVKKLLPKFEMPMFSRIKRGIRTYWEKERCEVC